MSGNHLVGKDTTPNIFDMEERQPFINARPQQAIPGRRIPRGAKQFAGGADKFAMMPLRSNSVAAFHVPSLTSHEMDHLHAPTSPERFMDGQAKKTHKSLKRKTKSPSRKRGNQHNSPKRKK